MRLPLLAVLAPALSGCLFPLHEARAREAAATLIRDCLNIKAYSDPDDGWLWNVQGCGYGVWCRYEGGNMHCTRLRPLEEPARAFLRCSNEKIARFEIDRWDPARDQNPWVEAELEGCGRGAWCGWDEAKNADRCIQPPDFDVVTAQLVVETGCPRENIEAAARQAFLRRTFVDAPERGKPREFKMQISWRLNACGRPYSCSVVGGLAPVVTCKAALDSVAPPADDPPPPPPPPSGL